MSFSWGSLTRTGSAGKKSFGNPANKNIVPFGMNVLHSLQVQPPRMDENESHCDGKGTFLLISNGKIKASLTIEAAFAMTAFLFAVIVLLNVFFLMHTQIRIQIALEQTGNQLAALPEQASLLTAQLVFREQTAAADVNSDLIVGGVEGISLARSSVMGHEPLVDLVADYRVRLPFLPEGVAELRMLQRSLKRAFGEADFGSEVVDYVYITPRGTVYHESMYCTYLRPKTEEVIFSSVADRRNQNGHKYEACTFCCDGEVTETVWITQWGENYHITGYCRGLWHQVEQVERSEVSEMKPCSKCAEERSP